VIYLKRQGKRNPFWRHAISLGTAASLSACASFNRDGPPLHPIDPDSIADAVPRYEPISPQGNPKSYAINGKTYFIQNSADGYAAKGIASWYGSKFHGRTTSNGETYDMYAMTAAHTTLPIPTYAQVTNLDNGRTVVVRINDRGPFHDNRLIDLSYAAAMKLDMAHKGTATVEVRTLIPPANGTSPGKMLSQATLSRQKQAQNRRYIQMGAFRERQNAQNLISKVTPQLDTEPKLSEHRTHKGLIYRVRLGPFQNTQQIENIQEQLGKMGIKNYFVVTEP